MKIKVVPALIIAAISALVAYGFYFLCKSDQKELLLFGSGVITFCTLVAAFALEFKNQRATTNIKVVSILFFVIALICNSIFAFVKIADPVYVIVNGLLLLAWLLVVYGIGRAKQ